MRERKRIDIVDKSKEGEEVVDGGKSIEENDGNKNDKVENDKNEQLDTFINNSRQSGHLKYHEKQLLLIAFS